MIAHAILEFTSQNLGVPPQQQASVIEVESLHLHRERYWRFKVCFGNGATLVDIAVPIASRVSAPSIVESDED
jgi:hypothetical protein